MVINHIFYLYKAISQKEMPERRAWTPQEDQALKYLREQLSINKWSLIAKRLAQDYQMFGRTGKQCRERYHNHLDSSIMHSEWARDEELRMYKLHDNLGNKWAIISQKLPGRTDNCVKNHFYSKLRKAIRKLNKVIHDNFRKEFKEIKITILYKIIEAADEKFKNSPSIDEEVSETCCKLKRMLLDYSNDEDNEFEGSIEKLRNLIKQIYDFSKSYRRKPKRSRKGSAHNELLKVPKFPQKKIRSSSQCSENQSDYSFVISHPSIQFSNDSDDDEDYSNQQKQCKSNRSKTRSNGRLLQDVMQEEDPQKKVQQEVRRRRRSYQMQSEKQQTVEQIMNEGRISIPIPLVRRRSSIRSDEGVDHEEHLDMFAQQLLGELNFNTNLNDDQDLGENKLFQN